MTSSFPEFMKNDVHAGKESLTTPDGWIELALYREIFGVERTLQLVEAQEFKNASTRRGWHDLLTSVYSASSSYSSMPPSQRKRRK